MKEYREGDRIHYEGKDWVFRNGKFQEVKEDKVDATIRFYDRLWTLLKILLIAVALAAVFYLRYAFDKWYVNWLID